MGPEQDRYQAAQAAPGAPAPVAVAPAAAPVAEVPAAPAVAQVKATVMAGDLASIDTLPRRIPAPVLRPQLSLCAPTGVEIGEGSRIVIMPDGGGVAERLEKRLAKAGATVLNLTPGVPTDELLTTLDGWMGEGPIQGVYWLSALDDEGPLDQLDLAGWREALRLRVKMLYATMRKLYEMSPFLVSGTRLGGYHGYNPDGATSPMGGSVVGFTKSYKKEKPDVLVKAVDFPAAGRKTASIATALFEETVTDPGAVEIGRPDVEGGEPQRWGVALKVTPFTPLADGSPAGQGGMDLNSGSVFIITGAAGSIVSAITANLAAVGGGTFHLLDLTPKPDPTDPDLITYIENKDALKPALAARLKEAGQRPTPVLIDRELAKYERLTMALAAIQAVESNGGVARYHSVNLTDADAVKAVVHTIKAESSKVDVLLHAAGLEISRNLPEKEPREFDLVLDVKSDGWFNVVSALGDFPIGATVAFSSVAGRFGNQGQTDYSSANDLLCKIASSFRRTRPGTRGIALDWTAWGGIGMATRGSIPKIMEMAGVQMLPPEAGIAWIQRELRSSDYQGEVVVAGRLGMMALRSDEHGGVDVDGIDLAGTGPMIGEIVAADPLDGVIVTTTLDPKVTPFLNDHRIDGTPYLPGAMGIEGFVEATQLAAWLAGSAMKVVGLEDVQFLAPVKFYRDGERTLTLKVQLGSAEGGPDTGLIADCRLEAERKLPGSDTPVTTVHFTGKVRLAPAETVFEEQTTKKPRAAKKRLTPDQVYAMYFHGPAYQVVGSAWRSGKTSTAKIAESLPHDLTDDSPLSSAPRLVELCFQTAGLWEAGRQDRLALPMSVGRVRWLSEPLPAPGDGALYAVCEESGGDEGAGQGVFDCMVVDSDGRVLLALGQYATVALPSSMSDEVAAPLREVYEG